MIFEKLNPVDLREMSDAALLCFSALLAGGVATISIILWFRKMQSDSRKYWDGVPLAKAPIPDGIGRKDLIEALQSGRGYEVAESTYGSVPKRLRNVERRLSNQFAFDREKAQGQLEKEGWLAKCGACGCRPDCTTMQVDAIGGRGYFQLQAVVDANLERTNPRAWRMRGCAE